MENKNTTTIPEQLKEYKFVKLLKKSKKPFEDGWPEKPYSYAEIMRWFELGNNYGVLGGYGGLIIIDADKQEISDLVRQHLPKTFTVKTPRKGEHFYLVCPDLQHKIVLKTSSKKEDHYGEIISFGSQAVGAYSIHPDTGTQYVVSDDTPIAEVSMDDILTAFKEFIVQKEPQKIIKYNYRGNSSISIADVLNTYGVALTKSRGGQLFGSHPIHGSTNGFNFVVDLEKNVWYCFRCEGGGDALLLIGLLEKIIDCNTRCDKKTYAKIFEAARDKGFIKELVINKKIEQAIPEKRTPISFEELEKIISKWLLLKDRGLIRVLMATVIANKLSADPVWLFLVAAPGGTKTELIRGLNKIDGIYPISDLTPQTFLSGDKGKNVSLLMRIPENTIFTYKDFTTVLTMHRDKQQAIISQLREIYDGSYRKEFGNGESRDWTGKIGFIAGVTSVIDKHYEIYSVLGERFIQYRPIQPDGIALAKRAISNSGGEKNMREEVQNAMADFIAGIEIPDKDALVSEKLIDRIAHLAELCVKARSGISRDNYSVSREIDLIPDTELPTRLAKQLITLYSALSLIGGASPEENYEFLFKIGMDNLPQKRRRAFELLIAKNEQLDTAEVAEAIGYPTNTTRRVLEDMHGLGLILKEHGGQGRADKWQVSDYTKELLEKAKPIKTDIFEKYPNTIKGGASEILSDITAQEQHGTEQDTLPEMSTE